ncbi:sterol desaturase family protein [Bdellovibrio sp. HCB337]|uniref:sterol desaturase family protein n=1 Tax=Bdellovibrio sp. HCB337 TaxID=3394358 RepID=UPI0039A4E359
MIDILLLILKVLPFSLTYSFVSNYFYYFVIFQSKLGKRIFLKKKLYNHEPGHEEALKTFKQALLSETMFSTVFIAIINSNAPILKTHVKVRWGLAAETWWIFLVEASVLFIINEIYHYTVHRNIHRRKVFKFFHVLHHSIRYPIPQSASVAQWTEQILFVIPFVVLLFCDVHIISILLFSVTIKFFSLIQHSGHEFVPGHIREKFPFKYLNTASFHQVHHSVSMRHNYGFVTNILDRIFKTRYHQAE